MNESFFKYLQFEKNYSLLTIKAYRDDLVQFLSFLSTQYQQDQISTANHIHVRAWLVHMMQNDYSPRSINRKISVLKSYFKYLKKKGLISKNPMSKIVSPKMRKRLPEFIREKHMEDLDRIMSNSLEFSDIRNELIISFLYELGLRRSELIGLQDSDINFDRLTIKVLGKGNKERIIPMSSDLSKKIENYLSVRIQEFDEPCPSLFVTDKGKKLYPKFVYNLCTNYLKSVSSNQYLGPHVLRHTFATHLANNGADLNAIKELMGHSSLAATQVYMHNTIEKLKEIYSKSHPKAKSE